MSKMLSKTIWVVNRNASSGFSMLWSRHLSVSCRAVMDKATKDGELRVFIVSGEVSGDTIGSRLMASLKKLSPLPVRFSGVGGSMMSKQGLNSIFPMEDIAVMGIWELLPHLYKFRVKLKETVEAALLFQPHVVVTIDSKARFGLSRSHAPIHFHYVAPSFWAWKGGEARLRGLAEFVDHVLCILPNEDVVCKSNGLAATFVGHPILEDVLELNPSDDTSAHILKILGNSEAFRQKFAVPSATVLTLLPGSRLQEVTRMLPIFANTIELLKDTFPNLITIIHIAPNHDVDNYISGVGHNWPVPAILIPGGCPHLKYNAFTASRVALCTSGTVAVELQVARLPCVVAYRAHFLTEWFIQYKAKIPYISLPNILLDSAIIPEALFQACTPTKLASLLMELIQNEVLRKKQTDAAEDFVRLLRPAERISEDLLRDGMRPSTGVSTPSMVAASAILAYVSP